MPVKLTSQDIYDLKRQGYSEAEISKAISELEKEELSGLSSSNISTPTQASSFSVRNNDDVAKLQLELNDILEQTEHILSGDVVVWKNGKREWQSNPKPEENTLSKEGVRKIMLELQNYVNRHIIMGDYDIQDIKIIMKDYGKKLNNLIFMKYEELGMDNEAKRQEYASLCMNIVNLVYGSYSRAKDGQERDSLRKMMNIQGSYQAQGMGVGGMGGGITLNTQGQKSRGVLNPMRYIAGKYV